MVAKVIFHIDLNAYFASAEILKDSSLEGCAMVVASLNRRSVVCTASYEARALGIHAAMPLAKALKICPSLRIVEGDYRWYEFLSERFFNYLKQYCPLLEPASIDECYLDVSDVIKKYERPLDLAWIIQKKVYEDLRLPCSIGIGPNKFLAKMASDMRKPMGITVLRKADIPHKLWPLAISEMYGIGKKSVEKLKEQQINTIYDLANPINENKILSLLGKNGYSAIMHARGYGTNQLNYNHTIKSLSQSTTLDKDISDYDTIKTVLHRLAKSLSHRAINEKAKGSLISLSIRYYDFSNVIRSTSLHAYINDFNTIYENALLLFDKYAHDKSIRHLGIALGSLKQEDQIIQQLSFFDNDESNNIDHVIKQLNDQIPNANLFKTSDLLKKNQK